MNWDEVTAHLKAPLDPDNIKPPPKGKYGEYVDGLHVIREANRIFGHGGWSYEITRLELVSRIETPKPQVRVGYMATVKVTIGGVTREGSAVGSGMVHPDSEADGHESAIKEAETDAMKRAMRTLGNTFGLALYDKDKANREVGKTPEPKKEKTPETVRDYLQAQTLKATSTAELEAWWDRKEIAALQAELPEPMQNEVRKSFTDRMAAVFQAPTGDESKTGHTYQ
jgi:DNA repair and recombination protein RAD52